jgi:hypothetical protein
LTISASAECKKDEQKSEGRFDKIVGVHNNL